MSETEFVSKHLIARHAGSALWLARYMERIENQARLLDVAKTFARDDESHRNWLSLLRINGDAGTFFASNAIADATSVARFYLLDDDNPTSVQSAIRYARESARTLRALISTEMWLQINVFHGRIRALTEAHISPEGVSGVCAMLKEGVQAHTGITEGTFYRDQCWHFYMMGRHIERADQITRLIDTKFHALMPKAADAAIDAGEWNELLRAAAGYHAYRREYPHGYRPPEVAGFLLLNTAFPRSAGLSLAQLDWHLTTLRSRYHLRGCTPALARLDELQSMLAAQTVEEILRRGLSQFLDWMQRELGALHTDIMTRLCGAPVLSEQKQEQTQS
jgi:uncharacterized alpha-E superfamily protein